MADAKLCDRCLKASDKPLVRRGTVGVKDYCEDCVDSVDAYLQERDLLHESVKKAWLTGLESLRKKYGAGLPDE